MRTQILLSREHGATEYTLLCGPEVPIAKQEAVLREYRLAGKAHETIAEIQRWEPDQGTVIKLMFEKPQEIEARLAKVKAEYAAHVELMANPAKAEKSAKAAAKAAAKALAEKNEQANAEATKQAEEGRKAEQARIEKNLADHKAATLLMAQRRAAADKEAAEKAAVAASATTEPPLEETKPPVEEKTPEPKPEPKPEPEVPQNDL